MLDEYGLKLLIIVGKLQLNFWQILLEIDLDDAFEDIFLFLKGELIILENLCKH